MIFENRRHEVRERGSPKRTLSAFGKKVQRLPTAPADRHKTLAIGTSYIIPFLVSLSSFGFSFYSDGGKLRFSGFLNGIEKEKGIGPTPFFTATASLIRGNC